MKTLWQGTQFFGILPSLKLSKKLTTITPFSKALAMFFFILFPFVGFYLGINYEQRFMQHTYTTIQVKTPSTNIVSADPDSAAYFVKTYYSMYIDCLNLHNINSCIPFAYNSNYIDPTLLTQLQQADGGDALLCASNIPPSISLISESYNKKGVQIGLEENFESRPPLVYVTVTRNNTSWKIVDIQCPQNK